jgi:threonine dehydrogenase-like Zn-dependent dehydrogenase
VEAIYFEAPGRVARREIDTPVLTRPTAALVRPLVVATCDLDTAMLRGIAPHPPDPFPFGHEAVAEVVEIGDAVTAIHPGQHVIVPFQLSCGTCQRCASGRTGRCSTLGGLPMYGLGALGGNQPGMLADLVDVPHADAMLIDAPPGPPISALASLSDNIPDAWRTVAPPLASTPGADVLVVGGGAISIGLYAVAIARALGAGHIHYLDDNHARLEHAQRLGATPLEWGQRPPRSPITVDASGTPEGLRLAINRTDFDGTCTSASIYFEPVELPLLAMYTNGVRLVTGRPHVRTLLPDIIASIVAGDFDPDLVPATLVPWDDAPEALADPDDKLVIQR